MNALLIAAHGSRKQSSNDEIHRLTEEIRAAAGPDFDLVICAFMQFATPSITDVIQGMAARGVTHITVFPHFIAAGSHVVQDIPAAVDSASKEFPDITFQLMPHLGQLKGIARLILANTDKSVQD